MRVGLGSGRAAEAFVRALAAERGLEVLAIPTSRATAALATSLGLAVSDRLVDPIDITVDGADEVDPRLDLIKGYGGALLRERIVAAASRRQVILVTPEKLVPRLGTRGRLPVEIVPFADSLCERRLRALGGDPHRRETAGAPFVTDNGNWILDCGVDPIADPRQLELAIRAVPGVVGTGLFLGMADSVVVENDGRVEIRTR